MTTFDILDTAHPSHDTTTVTVEVRMLGGLVTDWEYDPDAKDLQAVLMMPVWALRVLCEQAPAYAQALVTVLRHHSSDRALRLLRKLVNDDGLELVDDETIRLIENVIDTLDPCPF